MKSPLPKSCSFHVLCNSTDIRFHVKKVHVLYYQYVEVHNYVHVDDVRMESAKYKIVK